MPDLPKDSSGASIQALALGTSVVGTIGAASVNLALPTGSKVVRLASTGNCYIKFGTGSQTATTSDAVFPTGVEIMEVPINADNMAFIQVGASTGVISVTKMD